MVYILLFWVKNSFVMVADKDQSKQICSYRMRNYHMGSYHMGKLYYISVNKSEGTTFTYNGQLYNIQWSYCENIILWEYKLRNVIAKPAR